MAQDPPTHISEAELLNKARKLDQQALAQLHDLHYRAVYRYIGFRVSDLGITEDLANEVFVRFLQALHKNKGPKKNVRNWLLGTASNVVNDHFRKLYRHEEIAVDETLPAVTAAPEAVVQQQLQEEALTGALTRLTDEQQNVLALRFGAGHSIKKVASLLQKSEGSIKMLQARAIKSLSEWLNGSKES